ncbi:MAG: hypothetical protein M3132_09725 [Actinomycetia bacterium]|nr:hypothetical protein [Actinomycetes bacterium]
MQVRHDRNTDERTSTDRPMHRFFEAIADFFSPTLVCAECQAEHKQRQCHKTGVVRPVEGDYGWSQVTANEIEFICPSCGESIWALTTQAYYYPLG